PESAMPPVWRGALICAGVVAGVLYLAWRWLRSGYRMKA
ncbi:hypothetical protein MGSAQ_002836, partial [marine sediment metagenome]